MSRVMSLAAKNARFASSMTFGVAAHASTHMPMIWHLPPPGDSILAPLRPPWRPCGGHPPFAGQTILGRKKIDHFSNGRFTGHMGPSIVLAVGGGCSRGRPNSKRPLPPGSLHPLYGERRLPSFSGSRRASRGAASFTGFPPSDPSERAFPQPRSSKHR